MSTNGRTGGTGGNADRDPRLDRLYRETPREEPPAHLDAAILEAAHREAGARPRPLAARLRAWRVPVSIAAVMVLSVSVVTLVREEGGDKLDSSPANRASRSMERAAEPQMAEERSSMQDRASPAQSAPEARSPRQQEALMPDAYRRQDQRDDAVRPGAPADKEEASQRRAETQSAKLSEDAARRRSAGAAAELSDKSRASAPPVTAPDQPSQGAPATRSVPSTGSASGADTGNSSIGIRNSGGDTLFAPSPGEPKPQGGAEELPQGARAERPASRERAGSRDETSSPGASPRPAPAARQAPQAESRAMAAERPPALSARVSPLVKELESQPAEKWIERIEALRREERAGDADELLAEFRRRYPDYPLPAASR